MATITKTIGAKGRDYKTIAEWEADIDLRSRSDIATKQIKGR